MTGAAPLLAVALPAELSFAGPVDVVDETLATVGPTSDELDRLLAGLGAARGRLRELPVERIARALGEVGARFLRAGDPLREEALARIPDQARISPEQARYVLDGMARDWTVERLLRLLGEEFGDHAVLDAPTPVTGGRTLMASGPDLALHVCAGTVPGVSVTSLIRALLVKGPVLLKPGAGDAVLPVLFARGLAELQEETGHALAAATAVVYWVGGTRSIEDPVLDRVDQVVAYGGDDTVASLRGRLRPGTRLVDYPHRVSVAVVGPDADPQERAPALARAVAAFDQRGCVSPRQLFLPGLEAGAVRQWMDALDRALEREAAELPAGPATPEEASAVHQLRGTVEMRAAAGEGVELRRGDGLGWTLVLDPEPSLRLSCQRRTVHLTPLAGLDELGRVLAPVGRWLQTVGLEGFGEGADRVAKRMAEVGATRIVAFDEVAFPPAWWLHDGRGPLRRLVRWTELGR